MLKNAIIVISLVEESVEKSSEEIEREIFDELSKGLPKIPWCKRVEKVTVTEAKPLYFACKSFAMKF